MATYNGTALGNDFNAVIVGDAIYVNMEDHEYVTFLGYKSGGDTYTVNEGTAAGGGTTAALAAIVEVYTSNGVGGAWTKVTQAAGSAYVASADAVSITIRADQMSDGKKFLNCASTSTGTVTAILGGLKVKRTPANLPSVIV